MEDTNMESELKITYTALFFAFLVMAALFYLTSCTYSVTQVQTRGTASDVVDETASNTPSTSVTPTMTIPAAVL